MAARDAVAASNGPSYQVETGRKDGLISNPNLAARMPESADSIEILIEKFKEKGLNEADLVILSAAHTIGTTACFFVRPRLYSFESRFPFRSDPRINANFLPEFLSTCPKGFSFGWKALEGYEKQSQTEPNIESCHNEQIWLKHFHDFSKLRTCIVESLFESSHKMKWCQDEVVDHAMYEGED
ncbi:peroxidase 43-like [Rutidosis leptorrhynchoides]|uniref:peroxidase 43-like n=1 Tax=Rutidosis leptorrhynchoides TaxID=125765 RepID=UPI003A9A081E